MIIAHRVITCKFKTESQVCISIHIHGRFHATYNVKPLLFMVNSHVIFVVLTVGEWLLVDKYY